MKKKVFFSCFLSFILFSCGNFDDYTKMDPKQCTVDYGYETKPFGTTADGVELKTGDYYYEIVFKGDGITACKAIPGKNKLTAKSFWFDFDKMQEYMKAKK